MLHTKSTSLLVRLLIGFITVILLLVSFNYWSFTFFQKNIREEIISNSEQNIRFTAERYEKQLQLIQKQIYTLFFNDELLLLTHSENSKQYLQLSKIRQDFTRITLQPLSYIEDIILIRKDQSLVLSKSGTNDRTLLFNHIFQNEHYTASYWMEQFLQPYTSKLLPATNFYEESFQDKSDAIFKGKFLPYIHKQWRNEEFYLIAMLNADQLFQSFHRSMNDNFLIIDENKQLIYANGPVANSNQITLPANQSYLLLDKTYYFYETGEFSGFTYLNVVPASHISQQIARLQLTLFALLIVALVVSVVISIWFSMQFNKPIKQIMYAISKENNQPTILNSAITEFQVINRTIHDIKQRNAMIESDLMTKNKKLAAYDYLSELKDIYNGSFSLIDMKTMKNYRFILYQLYFKDEFWEDVVAEPAPITYSVYQFINQCMADALPGTLTFQVESRQILSIISDVSDEEIHDILNQLLQVLEHDANYYYLTIVVSPIYESLTKFTKPYEHTLQLLQQRSLHEQTQIIWETVEQAPPIVMNAMQEQQLDNNLLAGNTHEVLQIINRHLQVMKRKYANMQQFQQLNSDIINKVRKTAQKLQLNDLIIEETIAHAHAGTPFSSARQFTMFFNQLLIVTCEEINKQSVTSDSIITFVVEYVNENYQEEISLDIIAEQLHITGGYLSTYFKENTGEYFVDYVNAVRIRQAQSLLLETNLKIQEIALQSGYQNINSFNRLFKKFVGKTPREFRNEKRALDDV